MHFDDDGKVRVISAEASYERFVDRSFDKIRQAGRGMPAVMIRQLAALVKVMTYTTTPDQQRILLDQADMILRSSEESVTEPSDRADVRRRYDTLITGEIERRALSPLDDRG